MSRLRSFDLLNESICLRASCNVHNASGKLEDLGESETYTRCSSGNDVHFVCLRRNVDLSQGRPSRSELGEGNTHNVKQFDEVR